MRQARVGEEQQQQQQVMQLMRCERACEGQGGTPPLFSRAIQRNTRQQLISEFINLKRSDDNKYKPSGERYADNK